MTSPTEAAFIDAINHRLNRMESLGDFRYAVLLSLLQGFLPAILNDFQAAELIGRLRVDDSEAKRDR